MASRAACCFSVRSRTKGGRAVLDGLEEQGVGGFVAPGGIVIELPDDLAADEPEVVEVAAKCPGGESLVLKVRHERVQSRHEAAADGLVLVGACPALGPAGHEGDHCLG